MKNNNQSKENTDILVAYFSCTGTTKPLAEYAAEYLNAGEFIGQERYSMFLTMITFLVSIPYILPFLLMGIKKIIQGVTGNKIVALIFKPMEALLKQDDVTLIEKKDYIANPKENGYRSLHMIVETPIFLTQGKRMMKVEIQLRTIAMDFWASLEHQPRYKKDVEFTSEMADELYQCAETSAELDRRMDGLRKRIQYVRHEKKSVE